MVVRDYFERAAIEVGSKFTNCPNDCKALFFCDGVVVLGFCQSATCVRHDILVKTSLALSQDSAETGTTGVRVKFSGRGRIKMAQYRR